MDGERKEIADVVLTVCGISVAATCRYGAA